MTVAPLGGELGCPAQRHTIYHKAAANSWRTSKNCPRSSLQAILARACGTVISQHVTIARNLNTQTSLALCASFDLHYSFLFHANNAKILFFKILLSQFALSSNLHATLAPALLPAALALGDATPHSQE